MSEPGPALVLLLGALAGAGAAAQQPSLEVVAGFGGYYKVGSALPVKVTVGNRGADWRGEIRAGTGEARLSIPVTLPSPSRKSFFFTLPAMPAARKLEVRLVESERTAASVDAPLKPLSAATLLFVAVSERTPDIPAAPVGGARLAFVPARDLPEDWRGYGSADGLILAPAVELPPAQDRALDDWLLLGGRMVPHAPPRTAAQALELFAGRYAVAFASADRGLLRQAPVDAGLRPRPAVPLIAFFLGYWLAVAVALTRASRPPRHPARSLGALVVLAALFTVALGGLGRIAHGGRVPLSAASLVHVFAGADESFVASRVDLLSLGEELRIEARLRDASLETEDGGTEYLLEPDGRTTLTMDAPLWSRRRIWAEGFLDAGFRLEAAPGGPARIVNLSRLGLSRCRLLAAGRARPLGDVPAGESVEPGRLQDLPDPGGSGWLERVLAAYRMEGSGGAVLCSAAGELSVLAADHPFDELGAAAVVVFHLPEGWR